MSTTRPDRRVVGGPMHRGARTARRAAGIAAVTAIAILVVLSLLGAFIVSVSGIHHRAEALDLLGSRAYQAAKSGIEWAAYTVYAPESTSGTPAACPAANISGLAADLADFTVTVSCSLSTYSEFGNTVRIYEVSAIACNLPTAGACPNDAATSPSYVERKLHTVAGTCRLPGGTAC